jgi:hypothetical protein
MTKQKKLYWTVAVLLGLAAAVAWAVSRAEAIGWLHLVGVALTLLLLLLIWRWPGVEQPRRAPD